MRHHAVVPLMGEERLDLGPAARHVEMRLAERGEAGIPVPLERIEALGGDIVDAAVILLEHGNGVFGSVGTGGH
jgi:hypothetical protein